jgi:Ribbon-helix-helix protein, copG family
VAVGTQRVVVLMPAEDKARAEEKARRAGVSVGELVRRSIAAYEPELEEAEFEALLRLLQDSQERAMQALDAADRELAATEAYFAAKRA